MSGLVVSPIDRWFMGPVPQFSPHDLGVPGDWADMKSAAHRARRVLKEPRLCAWQYVSSLEPTSWFLLMPLARGRTEHQTKRPVAPGPEFGLTSSGIGDARTPDILRGCQRDRALGGLALEGERQPRLFCRKHDVAACCRIEFFRADTGAHCARAGSGKAETFVALSHAKRRCRPPDTHSSC